MDIAADLDFIFGATAEINRPVNVGRYSGSLISYAK
jgi:hypothetical protein